MSEPIQFVEASDFLATLKTVVHEVVEACLKTNREERFLTIKETCDLLKVTRPTLDKWTREGKLNKYCIANQTRYKYSEVFAACESQLRYKRLITN